MVVPFKANKVNPRFVGGTPYKSFLQGNRAESGDNTTNLYPPVPENRRDRSHRSKPRTDQQNCLHCECGVIGS